MDIKKLTLQEKEERLDWIEDKETKWDAVLDIPFDLRPLGKIRTDEEIEKELKKLDKEWEMLVDSL